eukprot:scaffold35405_cov69-Phaeocystis_antarctica.AAC.2
MVPVFCCAPAKPMPSSIATARALSIFTWVPGLAPWHPRRRQSLPCNSAHLKITGANPTNENPRSFSVLRSDGCTKP